MCGTNSTHDTFADACDDGLFSRPADESIEMRTHRDPRLYFHANTVLCDAVDGSAAHRWIGRVNHFRIDAGAHRFQDGFASAFCGKIDSASSVEIERNPGLVSSNQSEDHMAHIAACEVMRFRWIATNIQTGFHRSDAIVHD